MTTSSISVNDHLVRFHRAALACNDAATNALGFLRWLNGEEGVSLSPYILPFPRGQALPGRPGESFEDAVRRNAATLWANKLQAVLNEWNTAARTPECLEQIKRTVLSLNLPPVCIGAHSFLSAHEAAHRRASELLDCFQGRMCSVSSEASTDLSALIEKEYLEAVKLQPEKAKGGRKPRRDKTYKTIRDQNLTNTQIQDRFGVTADLARKWKSRASESKNVTK